VRIATISPMINPLSQPYAGGTEAMTAQLAMGLAGRGHQVTVFATEGSEVDGARVETLGVDPSVLRWPDRPDRLDGATMRAFLAEEQRVFLQTFLFLRARERQFDLVHNNSFSGMPLLLADSIGLPMVTTLHVPPILLEQVAALRVRAEAGCPASLVAVSEGLRREFKRIAPVDRVIHNGVTIPAAPTTVAGSDLLFAGRLSPEKGVDLAIAVARSAGRHLRIAGRIEDADYFQRDVAPQVDGGQVTYLGHLTQTALWEEMSRAAAMLFTPRWPEPCSLAVLEALSRGTPAIAFAVGGLVEQIVDGTTGYLVPDGDVEAAARAVALLPNIERDACRRDIVKRFSIEAMIARYDRYFQSIVDGAVT
jgi:UDP-glucose:tetrahydrobiopterin glucosyltransferase